MADQLNPSNGGGRGASPSPPTARKRTSALLFLFLFSAALVAFHAGAQAAEEQFIAVRAGKLIVGNGEEKENVTVLLRDGKVDTIGDNVELPFPCEVIDASDKTVMPGLIHPESRLGLLPFSINGQRAERRVLDEFMPDEEAYETALKAGFTTIVLSPPASNGVGGRALAIRSKDMGGGWIVDDDGYLLVNLRRPGPDKPVIKGALKAAEQEIEKRKKAKEEWEKKKKEAEEAAKKAAEEAAKKAEEAKKPQTGQPPQPPPAAQEPPKPAPPEPQPQPPPQPGAPAQPAPVEEFKPPEVPANLKTWVDLLDKKEGVIALAHLGGAATYLHYREAIKGFEFRYVLEGDTGADFFGVADIYLVAKELALNKELVLVVPQISQIPYSSDRNNIPRVLVEAGARVAFRPASDSPESMEGLRFQTAEVIKGGLDRKEALKALGVHAAEVVGLQDRLGSIEKGKDGNLLILSGDPFDLQTQVDQVLIEGKVAWRRED